MSERLFVIILIVGGLVFAYLGLCIHVPFAYDPLGPKAFPVFLGFFFVFLNCLYLFSAGRTVKLLTGNVGKLALAIIFYFLTFRILGFMLSTIITVYYISRLRGSSWMQGLLTGLVLSICFYGVFHFLLHVSLPLGTVFRAIG